MSLTGAGGGLPTALALPSRKEPDEQGVLVQVTPEDAGWKYVSFKVWRLEGGASVTDDTAGEEVGLVVLGGRVTVRAAGQAWEEMGQRNHVFEGNPYVLYLPPGTPFTLEAVTPCEVARCGAPAQGGIEPYLIRPEEVAVELRGQGNAQRHVRHLLEGDRPAERLLLVEVITPSGNWSSYPPHKHDTHNPPEETYLEETYYHRFQPRQGFGFQRVYTLDGSLDEALVIEDGTVVMVPKGYHPVVTAPGYNLYYLNVMAGPERAWRFRDDPHHQWVAAQWQPYQGG